MKTGDNGPCTNAENKPVKDPTENVREIVNVGNARQDDLRDMSEKLADVKIAYIEKTLDREREHQKELRASDAIIRRKETERIDAIFRESSSAVSSAAAVQLAQQNTLAATVSSSAEAMRNQVGAQADTIARTLVAELSPIKGAISELQRFQFESGGAKQQVVESRDDSRSSTSNVGMWLGIGIAAMGLLLSFLVIAGTVLVYIVSKP
jgi:hypothetical protein